MLILTSVIVTMAHVSFGSQIHPPMPSSIPKIDNSCSCSKPDMKNSTCIGTGYTAGRHKDVASPSDCCSQCDQAHGCIAWTWAPPSAGNYNCWLKDNRNYDPHRCDPDRVSGACGYVPPSPSPSPVPTTIPVSVQVHAGDKPLRTLPPTYMGVTLDWWPPNRGTSGGWGSAGLLNIDLQNPRLRMLTQALKAGTIRVGGSLDKQVNYLVGGMTSAQCGEQGGDGLCLNMTRWAEFVDFVSHSGASLTWGLSYPIEKGTSKLWNKTNPEAFLDYVGRNATQAGVFNGIELGEELQPRVFDSGFEQYMQSFADFKGVRDEAFKSDRSGIPGSYGPCPGMSSFDSPSTFWLPLLNRTARDRSIDAVVFHSYNNPPHWPMLLNNTLQYARELVGWVREVDTAVGLPKPRPVVLGEGGPHNGGGIPGVTNAYASSIYYLDALGALAKAGVDGFNRQTLVGGHYELLNTTTFEPYPDYWVGYGYNRLVGPQVLEAEVSDGGVPVSGGPLNDTFRVYAHCAASSSSSSLGGGGSVGAGEVPSAGSGDVVVFWSSASVSATFQVTMRVSSRVTKGGDGSGGGVLSAQQGAEVYALSPAGGDLYSHTVQLNGKPLVLGPQDYLPAWVPEHVAPGPDGSVTISVPPMGTGWAVLAGAGNMACF